MTEREHDELSAQVDRIVEKYIGGGQACIFSGFAMDNDDPDAYLHKALLVGEDSEVILGVMALVALLAKRLDMTFDGCLEALREVYPTSKATIEGMINGYVNGYIIATDTK